MKRIIILILLAISNVALPQTKLMESETRPRISVVRENLDQLAIPANQLVKGDRFNLDQFKYSLEQDAPQFIAKIEKAFPNAIFMFMGRDTQLIADVVDAFYLSIGQKDRVRQLGVSSPTLAALDEDSVIKYLEQYGITMKTLKDDKRPIVLVDTISRGEVIDGELISGRQGRHILQIVYKKWTELGYDPNTLLSKFNMVGMRVSTFRDHPDNEARYQDIALLEKITKVNQERFAPSAGYDIKKIGRNFVVPLVADTANLFNEAGYDHYTATWHDKYQPPKIVDGKLTQNPGPLMPAKYRWSVLWMQKQVIDFVFTPQFTERVFAAGIRLGVEFKAPKLDEVTETKIVKKMAGESTKLFADRMKTVTANLPILGEKYIYIKMPIHGASIKLTENGVAVLNEISNIESIKSDRYIEIVLTNILKLHEEKKIGGRDVKRIFTYALGLKEMTSQNDFLLIQKSIKKSEPLLQLFGRESDRQEILSGKGLLKKNYQNILKETKLPLSCRYLYAG